MGAFWEEAILDSLFLLPVGPLIYQVISVVPTFMIVSLILNIILDAFDRASAVVKRQKLLDQNISFQRNCLTLGKSRFINRALALLYALMNFISFVLGCVLNIM